MYVMTTEKLSVTIDKGKKPGHFCKIKPPPPPPDIILKPEKEDMSGKTRMYRNPTIMSSTYRVSLQRRMLDTILYVVDNSNNYFN
jgi:hypothetical protein